MVSLQREYYLYNILIIVLLFATACAKRPPRPVGPGPQPRVQPTAKVPRLQQPTIRIGLKTDVKSSTISSEGELHYSEGNRSGRISSPATVALSFVPQLNVRYTVQVGSFSTRENAESARRTLKSKTNHPSFIFENTDLHKFQLRLGPFDSQEKAQQAIEEIKVAGYSGAFYVADSGSAEQLPELVVRDDGGDVIAKTTGAVHFWTNDETLNVDAAAYRGYISVHVNKTGRLTVVNVVNFEDYLKGVVPNEIGAGSPSTYEAVKAQAVAARTYAYKNLNQFDAEGYDICPTARCQVYSGFSKENATTSEAVEDTKGEVITYGGEPINALYTSTCGGKTENAEYMFEGWNYPYLHSVECYPEESNSNGRATRVIGKSQPWWLSWWTAKTGLTVEGDLNKPPRIQEAEVALSALVNYLGKTPCASRPVSNLDWIETGENLVQQLCWQAKRDSLLDRKDYQYFLSRLDLRLNPSVETQSFLFLFHEGIFVPPQKQRFDPTQRMTRGEFYQSLFNILSHYHQINTSEGLVRESTRQQIQVVDDVGVHTYELSQPVYLYQRIGENYIPKDELVCSQGDEIEFYTVNERIQILACELNQTGIAVDRSSKYSFWQESLTPDALTERVSKYLDVGEVRDVQPLSYGLSKRVYELKITGTESSGVLKGIRVRWALGLRDNLFVIDRTFDRDGRVKQFVFTGRGWGHGIGMCQIGAIGYAKQGLDYRSILKHYYSGVSITKIY